MKITVAHKLLNVGHYLFILNPPLPKKICDLGHYEKRVYTLPIVGHYHSFSSLCWDTVGSKQKLLTVGQYLFMSYFCLSWDTVKITVGHYL